MVRIAIVGNSGCGKSTLASALASYHGIPTLDLDSVAWIPGRVGEPRDVREATALVHDFCSRNQSFPIAQNEKLEFLLRWVRDYYTRDLSLATEPKSR